MKRNITGQSLSEYGMVFGLVVVVVIAGVTLLGNQGKQTLDESNRTLFGQNGNGQATRLTGMLSGPNSQIPGLTPVNITLSDGTTLSLTGYPSNLSKAVETAGTDGTTNLLIANLRSLAKQLKDKGKITEMQYNQLETLANQGHRLGEIERLLRQAYKESGSDSDKFRTLTSNFEGNKLTVEQLYNLLGSATTGSNSVGNRLNDYHSFNNSNPFLPKEEITQGNAIKGFGDAFTQAKNSGALNDPVLLNLVFNLSSQINNIAQAEAVTANKFHIGAIPATGLRVTTASALTHANSANICTAGNGTDTGIHCPKAQG